MNDDHNEQMHRTEPEDYHLVLSSKFNRCTLGTTERTVGFCVNSPDGAGYCDDGLVWIADQLTDPARVIEIAIHEGLHGALPDLTEGQVGTAAEQIAALVVGVFAAKGAGPLPELRPLLTRENVESLFGEGAAVTGELTARGVE